MLYSVYFCHVVDDLYFQGPSTRRKASDFAANSSNSASFCGVGFFYSSYDFDVSAGETCRPRSALWFLKDRSNISDEDTFQTENGRRMKVKRGADKLFDILLFNNDLSKVPEDLPNSATASLRRQYLVGRTFVPMLGNIFFPNLFSSDKKTLSAMGCSIGLASPESVPDGYFFGPSSPSSGKATPLIRGIVEAIDSTLELSVAMRQGISEAVNVAMQQLVRGVWWAEVVVPVLATNGHKLQLGVVYLLYPAFPVFTLATSELHLMNDEHRKEAVRVLVCLQRFLCTHMHTSSTNTVDSAPPPTMPLSSSSSSSSASVALSTPSAAAIDAQDKDRSILPIPPSTLTSRDRDGGEDDPWRRLSQLAAALPNVSPTSPPGNVDPASLPNNKWTPLENRFLDRSKYHFKILESVYLGYGKAHVEQSLRMHFKVMKALHSVEACREWVVFPLCIREFDESMRESGLVYPRLDPSKFRIGLPSDPGQRAMFFEALRQAMRTIHSEARVLHLDLYPSNIMWSWDAECQRIRIKIIDWDAAVLMEWHEYPHETAQLLVRNNRIKLAGAYDNRILDITAGENNELVMSTSMDTCFISLMEEYQTDSRLYSTDKSDLDDAFRCLVEAKLRSDVSPIRFYDSS